MTNKIQNQQSQNRTLKTAAMVGIAALAGVGLYALTGGKTPQLLNKDTFEVVIHLKEKNGDHRVDQTLTCNKYDKAQPIAYVDGRLACRAEIPMSNGEHMKNQQVSVGVIPGIFVGKEGEHINIEGLDIIRWAQPELFIKHTVPMKSQILKGEAGVMPKESFSMPKTYRYDLTIEIKV